MGPIWQLCTGICIFVMLYKDTTSNIAVLVDEYLYTAT